MTGWRHRGAKVRAYAEHGERPGAKARVLGHPHSGPPGLGIPSRHQHRACMCVVVAMRHQARAGRGLIPGSVAGAHGALIRASGARESATGQPWNTSPALTMYSSHARASICCFEPRAPVPGCFFAHLQATPQQIRHATRRPPRTVVGNLLFSLKVRRSALRHLMERAWWWYRRPAPRSAHPLRPRGAAVSTREYVPISHHGNQPLSVG